VKLAVSETVKERLDELVDALKKACGDDLSGVLVHGSAVRGGWKPGSNVDLVVVLKRSERETLERAANALQGARFSARIEAMILVEGEVARAADVYPIYYGDICRHHAMLYGHDPFTDLRIEKHHIRLRIEQELREAQIRMRRAVVDAQGNRDALRGAVGRKIKQVRSALYALLGQKGVKTDDDLKSVLAIAGKTFKVDVTPLTRVDEDPPAAHDALVKLLDVAIAEADAMEDKS
jgi:predicted nucleotidyltransferase